MGSFFGECVERQKDRFNADDSFVFYSPFSCLYHAFVWLYLLCCVQISIYSVVNVSLSCYPSLNSVLQLGIIVWLRSFAIAIEIELLEERKHTHTYDVRSM